LTEKEEREKDYTMISRGRSEKATCMLGLLVQTQRSMRKEKGNELGGAKTHVSSIYCNSYCEVVSWYYYPPQFTS
jgi:hypothetical protein